MILRQWMFVSCSLASGVAGCSSCERAGDRNREEPSAFEIAPGRPEAPWSWTETDPRPYAVPAGCRLLARPLRHARETKNVFFLAVPNDPKTLAVASGDAAPEQITVTRGLLSLDPDAKKESRDVPWLHVASPPVLAATSRGWIALLEEPDAFSPLVRMWLWREGGKLQVVGEGDRLEVVDARCEATTCALLSTRMAAVATRGATLWLGDPQDASKMKRVEVPAESVPEGAVPLRIAGWNGVEATIAFESPQSLTFLRAGEGGLHSVGSVPRTGPVLDVAATKDSCLVAMAIGEADDEGCVGEGAKVSIASTSGEPTLIPTRGLPDSGYARRLGDGTFVTWIGPPNCKAPERKVIHGVVLDAAAKPRSSAMAMSDANGHAVTTQGNEVHLWLRDPLGVTWLRAVCD